MGSLPWMASQQGEVWRPSRRGEEIYFHTRARWQTQKLCLQTRESDHTHTHTIGKNPLTFARCHIHTHCLAHNWNAEYKTKIRHGNAQWNISPQMNIVSYFFLSLKVILSLLSHKNHVVGAIEIFCELSLNFPRPLRGGTELDGKTISYRLRDIHQSIHMKTQAQNMARNQPWVCHGTLEGLTT